MRLTLSNEYQWKFLMYYFELVYRIGDNKNNFHQKHTHLLRIKKWPIFRYEKNFIMNKSFITKIVDKC